MSELLLYERARQGTGTSRGVSYWSEAIMCGRKRNLIQLHREVHAANEGSDVLTVGTYYHWLHEQWANGRLPEEFEIAVAEIQDAEWSEALRLFNFYRQNRPLDYFGTIVGSEVTFPIDDEHRKLIADFMGMESDDPDVPTGQADRLVYMSAEDCERVETDYEITLRGPGLYIHDHKTCGARKSIEGIRADWTDTVQALAYPVLYNLAPSRLGRVKGMIFDGIVKHRNLDQARSFQVAFAPYSEENDEIVKAAILEARYQRDRNVANPYACYSKFGKPCGFLENGLCPRK